MQSEPMSIGCLPKGWGIMHEMALVRSVLDTVLDVCRGKPIAEVSAVRLSIGELSDVVDDYVPGLFRYLAKGTVAENAEVVITRVPVRVRCKSCGAVFPLDLRSVDPHDPSTMSCPKCGAVKNYRMVSGSEFRIESIEVAQRVEEKPDASSRTCGDRAMAAAI